MRTGREVEKERQADTTRRDTGDSHLNRDSERGRYRRLWTGRDFTAESSSAVSGY